MTWTSLTQALVTHNGRSFHHDFLRTFNSASKDTLSVKVKYDVRFPSLVAVFNGAFTQIVFIFTAWFSGLLCCDVSSGSWGTEKYDVNKASSTQLGPFPAQSVTWLAKSNDPGVSHQCRRCESRWAHSCWLPLRGYVGWSGGHLRMVVGFPPALTRFLSPWGWPTSYKWNIPE